MAAAWGRMKPQERVFPLFLWGGSGQTLHVLLRVAPCHGCWLGHGSLSVAGLAV